MIVTENFKVGERNFIRTVSNSGRYAPTKYQALILNSPA